MRAWLQHAFGEPDEVMRLETIDPPIPGPSEVLISSRVVGISMPDLLLCRGLYQSSEAFPFTIGGEVSGVVIAPGMESGLRVGQRVVATGVRPGGLSELVAARSEMTDPLPDSVSFEVGACLPVNYVTAHLALHRRAGVEAGETVLVQGGAGGVGSAAIQLAALAGARVFATAVGPARTASCRELGVELVFDPTQEDVVSKVMAATDGVGVDVAIDPVSGDAFDQCRRCMAFEGRLVTVGFAGGRIADLKTNNLILRNYAVLGVNNGMYMATKPEVHKKIRRALLELTALGCIDPLRAGTWNFEHAHKALSSLGRSELIGKALVVRQGWEESAGS